MGLIDDLRTAASNIWQVIKGSPREMPGEYRIDPTHTDQAHVLAAPLKKGKHYFPVRVNEIYLSYDRAWFSKYEPMLFSVCEFLYAGEQHVLPTVVGPQMLPKLPTGELPERMILSNTRVAGLHPYRGGRITLMMILYRSERDNFAQSLLKLVESAAGALDFASVVGTYMKVAKVAVDGIQALLGLGKLQPLIGIRREFDPDAGDPLSPGYFVLCSLPGLDPQKMWVKDGKLLYGESLAKSSPLSGDDYVLYSIVASAERSDEDILPFYALYQQAKKLAASNKPEEWEVAKSNVSATYQMLVSSPDLTSDQAQNLIDSYVADVKAIHDKAGKLASLRPTSKALHEIAVKSQKILRLR